jgi:hypothetical protein
MDGFGFLNWNYFWGFGQEKDSGHNMNWLRWWDQAGNLLLWSSEQAQQERQRADKLAAKLRELGIDPEQL